MAENKYISQFVPVSTCQKQHLEKILQRSYTYVQKVRIRSYFSGLFAYDVHDLEGLEQCIIERGNVFYHHLLFCMERDSLLSRDEINSTPYAYYRFVWLYVERGSENYFVLSKGPVWLANQVSCRQMGESYFPEIDFPDDDSSPQFLLTIESKTHCQQPQALQGRIDVATIRKESDGIACTWQNIGEMGQVLKTSWCVYDGANLLHIYYVEDFDVWYYTYMSTAKEAIHELAYL